MTQAEVSDYLKNYIRREHYKGQEIKITLTPNALVTASVIYDTFDNLEILASAISKDGVNNSTNPKAYKIAEIKTIDNKTETLYGRIHGKN